MGAAEKNVGRQAQRRKLIGFNFERDVVCRGETLGIWQDRLRATAWNDRGELVGMGERIDGFPLPWPAC
jgi:hypothetical protein